jgi:predicted permease
MILLQIPKLNFGADTLIPVIVSWSVMAISALVVWLTAKYLNFSKNVTGALMLVSVLTNSSFVGIPLITAYLGESTLPYIIVYDQLGTFLALATYGTFITAYYSHQNRVNATMIVYKVLIFPPFITLVISLFLKDVSFIPSIENLLQVLSHTIIPFALIAVGLQLQFKLPKEEITPFTVSLVIKLIIAPIIALTICYAFSWDELIAKVSIMEAGMAPMITAAAMASMLGLAPRLSNAIVGYGILFSFATTWILYRVIELW